MSRKNVLWVVGFAGAGLTALGLLAAKGSLVRRSQDENRPARDQGAISARYIGSQLKEIDKAHASLIISYDLENNTDSDYRLTDSPSVVILSRLKSDGSFTQEQPIRLSFPVFSPARQHSRLAIEITQPFTWPTEGKSGYFDKMRNFVRQRLANVAEFVLFDETNHRQLELPSGWEQLEETSQARN